ncbi:DUF4357 domain-containing protein [Pseudomonas sp. MS15a(2019)]|uniref:DUF4357 domain-containing protein n=1 Tax=Pseudomonas sp. MS15a(2019) TaxID=2579938 RepID=UPI001567B118|nr:DUF4357 domain-containing protein [Pseudomonas sp. MS15a(2019)]NRH43007.1 DUF4357 domain-containing protein [Pseudomonas sp. MS15a(2019)]
MSHTLSAKEQALSKVFSDDYVFTIPGYQRPYAWGEEQAQELLDDLLGALRDAPEKLADSMPYFLGSVVLIKRDAVPDATVVDGQQRLTTLTLLLSAIRATVKDSSVQAGITKRIYETGDVVAAVEPRYRLSLRERDREFFRKYVQHENGLGQLVEVNATLHDAPNRMRSNARLFLRELSALAEVELVRLVQFIVTRCFLVVVSTPDLDSAYRIFGVLNSRGLDLSATDILKAEIIGSLPEALRDAYTKRWEDVEESLGRSSFSELFSHIRMVYRKAKPQGTLLKEFRTHVTLAAQPKLFMEQVLLPMAEAYEAITDAEYSSPKLAGEVNNHLRWLNRLEFKDWVPPALSFYIRHHNDPKAMMAFFKDLERLAYSMLVRKAGVNARIERFSKLIEAVEKGDDLALQQSPLQLRPAEQNETYNALNGPLYETHSSKALGVLLLRLDALLSDGSASYQHDIVSVEHVLPRQPASGSKWKEWVPELEQHQHWVHRLGNLALLSRRKNSSASNYEFPKKKTAYFTKGGVSSFALTTQVLQHDCWTADVIKGRQASLLSKLEQVWRLEGRITSVEQAMQQIALQTHAEAEALFELKQPKSGLEANARELGNEFVVLKGSKARPEWIGVPHNYASLHAQLREEGCFHFDDAGELLVFTRDVAFKSPSAASAVILGRADNGRASWRLQGTTIDYGTWLNSQSAERPASGRNDDLAAEAVMDESH